MIEVENLVKRYGNHVAVDHLSFHVGKGQIYGFLGPNGAGKSTTMNIMTGYLAATEGTVKINGFDVLKQPEEAKKSIGYLPEMPPLYTDMAVYEYLKFAAQLKKLPKEEREKQIEEVMEMTMISDMKGRLIKNLSKGYKQRVGLAQAILGYPEVIILDEPTVGLDPKQIIEIRDLIRKLGEKHTVILSSHILSEVSAVCDHIMIISHGKLVASDSPEGLQKLQNGKSQLMIAVKADKEGLEKVLAGMEGISTYNIENGREKDSTEAVIETEENKDIREELFFALAEKKMPLLEMQLTEKSLEDIFLELTQDSGQEKEKEKEVEKENEAEKENEVEKENEADKESNERENEIKMQEDEVNVSDL